MTLPSIVHDFALLDNAYERLKAHSGALNEIQRLQKQLATLDRKIAAWSKVALPEKQRNELLLRATLFEIGDRAARSAADRTSGHGQDTHRPEPGRVDAVPLPAALDRGPQEAAAWGQRRACARGLDPGPQSSAGRDLS